jgi:glycogen synthase
MAAPSSRMSQSPLVRILMLSAVDAGLGESVHALATALARAGHEVDLVAPEEPGSEVDETVNGMRVERITEYPPFVPPTDRLAWALQLSAGMLERSTQMGAERRYDVIHAHGWETSWAGAAAKNLFELPLVSSLCDCEYDRSGGSLDDVGRLVSQAEWWLTYESRRTIVPDDDVRARIEEIFELPAGKQVVVPASLKPDETAVRTAEVYAEAIADEAERRRRGDDRPPLRVILGRSQIVGS